MTEYCSKTGTEIDPLVINLEKPRMTESRPSRSNDSQRSSSLLHNLGNSISISKSRGENGFSPKKMRDCPKVTGSPVPRFTVPRTVKDSENWRLEDTDKGTRILKHTVSGFAMELYNATKNPEAAAAAQIRAKAGNPNAKVRSVSCRLFSTLYVKTTHCLFLTQTWSITKLGGADDMFGDYLFADCANLLCLSGQTYSQNFEVYL